MSRRSTTVRRRPTLHVILYFCILHILVEDGVFNVSAKRLLSRKRFCRTNLTDTQTQRACNHIHRPGNCCHPRSFTCPISGSLRKLKYSLTALRVASNALRSRSRSFRLTNASCITINKRPKGWQATEQSRTIPVIRDATCCCICCVPAPNTWGIKRYFCPTYDVRLTSVCLSIAYIGRNSRTERPTHTHSVLTAIFPGEPGLAGCPLNSPSPLIPELRILLGQA